MAEPTRRRIFELLLAEPGRTTADLVARLGTISRWGVMKHLDALHQAGLVQTMATGRERRHFPERAVLAQVSAWLRDLEQSPP